MATALKKVIAWVEAQTPEIQTEIALLTMMFMPGLNGDATHIIDHDGGLLDWLAGLEESNLSSIGSLLAFMAIFDQMIGYTRGTEQGWQKAIDFNKAMAESLLEKGSPDLHARHLERIEAMPARAQQWIAIVGSWKELVANELTPEVLDAWANAAMLKSAGKL